MAGPDRVTVVHQEKVDLGINYLVMEAPTIAAGAVPGQFVHVRAGNTHDPLLRRPFSVHEADRSRGTVSLLYQIRGRGTAWLASRRRGDLLDVLGPLGTGFPAPPSPGSCFLIGGGLGMAPLFFLARELRERSLETVLMWGTAGASGFGRLEALLEIDLAVSLATEDGSLGKQGLVTALLADRLKGNLPSVIYACGPWEMLREVSDLGRASQIPVFVSLEQLMACGTGLCRGCAVPVRGPEGILYIRACTEGPVQPAEGVVWDGA